MLVILVNHSYPGKTIGDCGGMEDGVGGGAPPPGAGDSKEGESPEPVATMAVSPGVIVGAAAGESELFATGEEPIAAIAGGAANWGGSLTFEFRVDLDDLGTAGAGASETR